MNTVTSLCVSVIFFMFIADESFPRPVEERRFRRKDLYMNGTARNSGRFRRSIPEADAVNPAYFDVESQPDQEQPVDPRGDVSPFSLTDQVGSLFRSHKLGKQAQKTHARPGQGERADNLVKEESAVDAGLPADEQEECYKQQNIESPSLNQPLREDKEPRSMPIIDVPQESQSNRERDHVRDVSGETHFEKQEVDSLYSDPEQVIRLKKTKYPLQSGKQDVLNEYNRVYKPLGVQPDFPIYDEDIDFHPDPLQGILDDKYWLDPQEQEAVVRKYIDLAANNMMPPGVEYGKRSAERSDNKVKSVNSKIGFKNIDIQCPCKEISACGDCSKGKGRKKTNYSDSGENKPDGKLLSLNAHNPIVLKNDKVQSSNSASNFNNNGRILRKENVHSYKPAFEDEFLNINDGEMLQEESGQSLQSYVGRKLLSFEGLTFDESPDDSIIENDKIGELEKESNFVGRHILSIGYYDADEELYVDNDYSGIDNLHSVFGNDILKKESISKEVDKKLEKGSRNFLSEHGMNSHDQHRTNKLQEFDSDDLRSKEIQVSNKEKITYIDSHNNHPGYYYPNRLANILQKPFQKNPKPKKKNMTDPTYEFEVMRNQTLYNASFDATSEKPPRPKICLKRGNVNYFDSPKSRRSYSNVGMVGKNSQVVPLFLAADGSMGSEHKDEMSVGNSTSGYSALTTIPANIAPNCTLKNPNITTVSPNKTSNLVSNNSKSNIIAKFDDRLGEEIMDTGFAKEIVDTVISESEKSAGLGHNLGICKRNESVTKVKYGKIVPEAERVLKLVTDCIMDRIKAHLAKQSCILLDDELLEFLKWLVLSGESYKEYMQRLGPKYYDFVPPKTVIPTTCSPPTSPTCEQEPLPPNPNLVSESANILK